MTNIKSNDSGLAELEAIRRRLSELESSQRLGLVWRDIPEEVESKLRDEIPVLIPEPHLNVEGKIPSDQSHVLIEGDNLHALHVLQATHRGAIDVIYIDPPYNRGGDFYYNDERIDKENQWRHSAWLSFMSKRLELAKSLLSDRGILLVSIDDNELYRLRLLLDHLFGEDSFVACLPTIMNLKGNQDEFGFAGTHEYTLVFVREKAQARFNQFAVDEEALLDDWQEDDVGPWKRGAGLKATGVNGPRKARPNLWFPIYVGRDGTSIGVSRNKASDAEVWPITDGKEMSWRWGKDTVAKRSGDLIVSGSHPNWTIYKKQRPELGELPSLKPKSVFYRPEYSTTNGTNLLKNMLGGRVFPNPKPLDLIVDLLAVASYPDSTILDFFAGSGTTLQAVATLNARDSGTRRCILVTNEESTICRKVTIPRVKAALTGKWADKAKRDALPGSMSFFRTDFIKRSKSPDQMRTEIAKHTIDLIAIKEAAGRTVFRTGELAVLHGLNKTIAIAAGLEPDHQKIYTNAEKKARPGDRKVVYLFTWSDQGVEAEFAAMWPGWEVEPLPAEMLSAMRRNAPQPKLFDTGDKK